MGGNSLHPLLSLVPKSNDDDHPQHTTMPDQQVFAGWIKQDQAKEGEIL